MKSETVFNTVETIVENIVEHKIAPLAINQGENKMADVDTNQLSREHGDIRRESAEHTADIRYNVAERAGDIRREAAEHRATMQLENMKGFDRVNADVLRTGAEGVKESLKESFAIRGDVKDSRHDTAGRINEARADLSQQVDAIDDTLTKQASDYFIANQQYAFQNARDVAALKAGTDMAFLKLGSDIATQGALGQAATALESAKVASAVALGQNVLGTAIALGQATLSKEIFLEGQKTRDLMNDLKYHDLNRHLIERNAELVEERHERRGYRDRADQFQAQGQWQAVQAQLQAFQSQLQTATQGTVNFGTMSGNAGRNTSTNNVV